MVRLSVAMFEENIATGYNRLYCTWHMWGLFPYMRAFDQKNLGNSPKNWVTYAKNNINWSSNSDCVVTWSNLVRFLWSMVQNDHGMISHRLWPVTTGGQPVITQPVAISCSCGHLRSVAVAISCGCDCKVLGTNRNRLRLSIFGPNNWTWPDL